jgi:hypothetical protein
MSSTLISKSDVDLIKKEQETIGKVVSSFQHVRQEQILKELSVGARARKSMLIRFNRWLKAIEKKVFDPNFIDNVPLDKLISLMKFTATINVKTLSSMGKLDEVMVKYFDIFVNTIKTEKPQMPSMEVQEISLIKKEILSKIRESLEHNCSDCEIIEDRKQDVLHNNDDNTEKEQVPSS